MKQVEVFKTDVKDAVKAEAIARLLTARLPQYVVNFDLEDCDNILRVEAPHGHIDKRTVEQLVEKQGHYCRHLL